MYLQAGLGQSSMFSRGNGEEAQVALESSLSIANDRGDSIHQLRMLSLLHMLHHRAGDARMAHACATRSSAVASTIEAPVAVALARAQLGISLTLAGDLSDARVEFEAALRQTELLLQGFDYRTIASGYLARVYWLQGYPVRAAASLRSNVINAARTGRPVSLTFALSFAFPLLLWLGDLDAAEHHMAWFVSHTETHSLPLSLVAARGFRGQLSISRGEAITGVTRLDEVMCDLDFANYNVWATSFNISRSQGLFQLGRFADAVTLIDRTIRQTEDNGDLTYVPELLRIKANVLDAMDPRGAAWRRQGGVMPHGIASMEPPSERIGIRVARRDRLSHDAGATASASRRALAASTDFLAVYRGLRHGRFDGSSAIAGSLRVSAPIHRGRSNSRRQGLCSSSCSRHGSEPITLLCQRSRRLQALTALISPNGHSAWRPVKHV
jgi:tetratricopeptide (TPR) repeat protein